MRQAVVTCSRRIGIDQQFTLRIPLVDLSVQIAGRTADDQFAIYSSLVIEQDLRDPLVDSEYFGSVLRPVHDKIPGKILHFNRRRIQLHFDARIADRTRIGDIPRETTRIRDRYGYDLVLVLTIVIGDIEIKPIVQEMEFGAYLEGFLHFRLQPQIANGRTPEEPGNAGASRRLKGETGNGAIISADTVGERIFTHLSVGQAELAEIKDPAIHIVQLCKYITKTGGRIEERIIRLGQGGAPVIAAGKLQEERILKADLGAAKDARVSPVGSRTERIKIGRVAHIIEAGQSKFLAAGVGQVGVRDLDGVTGQYGEIKIIAEPVVPGQEGIAIDIPEIISLFNDEAAIGDRDVECSGVTGESWSGNDTGAAVAVHIGADLIVKFQARNDIVGKPRIPDEAEYIADQLAVFCRIQGVVDITGRIDLHAAVRVDIILHVEGWREI